VKAPTDETLLREYLDGKAASFELLVRRHAQELHQFVLRFTGNSMAAEDVVQETFLQVHNSAESFDLSRRFKPWLFTIGANKARDHLRKVSRRREVSFDANVGGGDESSQRFIDLLAGDDVLPQDEMQQEERRRFVRGIMESVPAKLSEVLILAYFHRFAYKEIAEIVGIPLGTVKSRLHAAIACFGERYRDAIAQQVSDDE
jgi:RNA polymerase sigma-70 factor (ECF subfamily)